MRERSAVDRTLDSATLPDKMTVDRLQDTIDADLFCMQQSPALFQSTEAIANTALTCAQQVQLAHMLVTYFAVRTRMTVSIFLFIEKG
jgi:hypothetical protein